MEVLLRNQIEELQDVAASLDPAGDRGGGGVDRIGITFQVTTYPTTAQSVYACHMADPGGTETEGQPVTTSGGKGVVYALNLGSLVPPSGTAVILSAIGSRWVFRYG